MLLPRRIIVWIIESYQGRFFLALGALQRHPLFQPKLMYSYVIEVADFEYQLYLHSNALVSEISTFSYVQKNALC